MKEGLVFGEDVDRYGCGGGGGGVDGDDDDEGDDNDGNKMSRDILIIRQVNYLIMIVSEHSPIYRQFTDEHKDARHESIGKEQERSLNVFQS
jgi:hypothetical protein